MNPAPAKAQRIFMSKMRVPQHLKTRRIDLPAIKNVSNSAAALGEALGLAQEDQRSAK